MPQADAAPVMTSQDSGPVIGRNGTHGGLAMGMPGLSANPLAQDMLGYKQQQAQMLIRLLQERGTR